MSRAVKFYVLSEEADNDLDDIFDYTELSYGLDQAISYLTQIENTTQHLLLNPKLGRQRPEIKNGLRSIPVEEHIVFYRILKDHIRIVRMLHGSRDLPKYF